VPNLVSNHLTTGLLSYIHTTGRYTSGINLFEKLRSRDPEISSLLARVYIEADEEVKAVQLLHEAIQDLPMDYSLLDCQAEFCNKKGRGDLALEIAKRSVVSAPSEFGMGTPGRNLRQSGAVGSRTADAQLMSHVHVPGQGRPEDARAPEDLLTNHA
jgi:hypothetical protein